jgi:hypothetical protein
LFCMYIYAAFQTKNGNPGKFFLIRLLFAHRANGSLLFVHDHDHVLIKKQTEVNRLQTKRTCPSMQVICFPSFFFFYSHVVIIVIYPRLKVNHVMCLYSSTWYESENV